MKAIWYNEFGNAKDVLQYGEQDIVQPQRGEVLVHLSKSAINPSDVKKRMYPSAILEGGYIIPNSDGAGVIEKVGDGVDSGRTGERVWVYNGQFGRRFGTSAEYITLPEEQAVFLPDEASFEVGACMAIPAMTAHRCVTSDGTIQDKLVLVTGGSGRVGHYAIQWAKHFGATVIATAGSEKSEKHCWEAGADHVVGHPSQISNSEILKFTGGQKLDRVIDGDFGVNLPFVIDVLGTSSTVTTYASMTIPEPCIPFRKMMFMDMTIQMVIVYAMPREAKQLAAADITELLKNNLLKHRITHTYPLKDSALAHEAVESGNQFGCVLLDI